MCPSSRRGCEVGCSRRCCGWRLGRSCSGFVLTTWHRLDLLVFGLGRRGRVVVNMFARARLVIGRPERLPVFFLLGDDAEVDMPLTPALDSGPALALSVRSLGIFGWAIQECVVIVAADRAYHGIIVVILLVACVVLLLMLGWPLRWLAFAMTPAADVPSLVMDKATEKVLAFSVLAQQRADLRQAVDLSSLDVQGLLRWTRVIAALRRAVGVLRRTIAVWKKDASCVVRVDSGPGAASLIVGFFGLAVADDALLHLLCATTIKLLFWLLVVVDARGARHFIVVEAGKEIGVAVIASNIHVQKKWSKVI
eukprot:m.35399 g.35399  ORF g.35399 m.35399 type:complete len:309 (+) comp11277_c0_seq3:172-1098(+)